MRREYLVHDSNELEISLLLDSWLYDNMRNLVVYL